MIRVSCVVLGLILLEMATARPNTLIYPDINEYSQKQSTGKSSDTIDSRVSPNENSLESVVLAIDTGVKIFMAGDTKPIVVDDVAKQLLNFAKNSAKPIYKLSGSTGQDEEDLEIIRFRSSDKPPVMFERNTKSIINVLKHLLPSKSANKTNMDTFTKETSVIYRAGKVDDWHRMLLPLSPPFAIV